MLERIYDFRWVMCQAMLLLMLCGTGCDNSGSAPGLKPTVSPEERQEVLDAIEQADREAENTEPPKPIITLTTPAGWTRSETRALPALDNGFTVAYEHDSGLAVTLYQFTRGLVSISSDIQSPELQNEMSRAKSGIVQAVQLGYWEGAKEVQSGVVQLGDSKQKALWSQYHITMDSKTLASDIYVWTYANTFFKLRCTSRSEDASSHKSALTSLLTALGSPVLSATE